MREAIVFFIISSISALATGDQVEINTLVDTVLSAVVSSLEESGSTTLTVPDTEEDFKVLFVKGGIKFTEGVLSDFSTLARTGDAVLTLDDTSATLDISMGLATLELYYEHVRAWLGDLSTSERLSITVGENSIEAKITLALATDGTCTTTLDSVTVNEFGDYEYDLYSLGDIKYVADHIATWITDEFNDDITSQVETLLADAISSELASADLCSLI